jgi:chloride channel 3/4/5
MREQLEVPLQAGQTRYDEEVFELTEDGQMPNPLGFVKRIKYEDGSTIDWLHEESAERERHQSLRAQRGIRGIILPLLDASGMWFVVICTGIGIGIAGACLDILVKWYVDFMRF